MIGILFGPTGVGKSVVFADLIDRLNLQYISPYTTRPQRGPTDDKLAISGSHFQRLENSGFFIFINELFGFRYGTPREQFTSGLQTPEVTHLLDFPIEQIHKLAPFRAKLISVLLLPPSWLALEDRLKASGRTERLPEAHRQLHAYLGMIAGSERAIWEDRVVININLTETRAAVASLLSNTKEA